MRALDIISEGILLIMAMVILIAICRLVGGMTPAESTILNIASSMLVGLRTGTKYLLRKGK